MYLVNASLLEKWNALGDARIAALVVVGQTARRTFVKAYANLRQYDGMTPFRIWLTRIAVRVAARHLQAPGSVSQIDSARVPGLERVGRGGAHPGSVAWRQRE